MDKLSIMRSSVAKWNRIIEGKSADGGVLDCPPCRIFYPLVCFGCPIAQYTGKKFCQHTPYGAWLRHHNEVHADKIRKKVRCPECLRLAAAMRDFMVEIVNHLEAKQATGPERRSLKQR